MLIVSLLCTPEFLGYAPFAQRELPSFGDELLLFGSNRYQAASHCSPFIRVMCASRLRKIADVNPAQQVLDRVIHLPQRFFDGAMAGQVARAMNRDATGYEQRPVDSADYLKS
jgi:hypothetical protein